MKTLFVIVGLLLVLSLGYDFYITHSTVSKKTFSEYRTEYRDDIDTLTNNQVILKKKVSKILDRQAEMSLQLDTIQAGIEVIYDEVIYLKDSLTNNKETKTFKQKLINFLKNE